MNLYEIDSAITALVDQETGEIMDFEAFDALQVERTAKVEGMALWAKELLSGATAIKAEEAALAERRKSMERKVESLKRYLGEILSGDDFSTARCAITYRKSSALEIEDTAATAKWLESNGMPDLVVYSTPTIDKRSVTAYIKQGHEIPGAALVERQNLQLK